MKILHLRRHSIKDGPNNTIGPKGLELAVKQGKLVKVGYDKLFHGPLVRTAQTALAFCQGLGYTPFIMPVVSGLGDEALFAKMVTEEFRAAVKKGLSNFAAVQLVHDSEKIAAWTNQARLALMQMFDSMKDCEIGIGFFHSPTIELTALACSASDVADAAEDWTRLRDLEGLVFVHDQETATPFLVGKISVQPDAAK